MEEFLLLLKILATIGVSLVVLLGVFSIRSFFREEKRNDMELKEKQLTKTQVELHKEVADTFDFDPSDVYEILEDIHEIYVQDEIVRRMNLLACKVAKACVKQDKANRGETKSYYLGGETSRLKANWSKARDLALRLSPELKDRLPHFSEFEPLKSYREEHILQKKSK